MAFQAGAIVSKMTLDRSKFSASVKAVRKQTKSLGGWVKKNSGQFKAMGLAATAAGAAVLLTFKKMVKQFVETGDMIHKMALRTGFAAETLSELAYAADISGADITMLEKGVKKMSKTIVDASYGLETYLRVFRSLGLEIDDLLGMNPEQQFLKIGAAIADMESDTLRTAAAVDVFGRSGTMLLPLFKEGAEGIEKLREEARRLGIIFDEETAAKAAALKDAQTALTGSVKGLSIAILTDLIPVLTTVTKGFTDWFVESRDNAKTWTNALLSFFKVIAQGIQALMLGFNSLQALVFQMGEGVTRVFREYIEKLIMGFGTLQALGAPVKGIIEKLVKAWADMRTVEKGYWAEGQKHIDTMANIINGFKEFFTMLDNIKVKTTEAKEEQKSFGETIVDTAIPAARKMGDVVKKAVDEMESAPFAIAKSWQEGFWKIYRDATMFTSSLSSLFDQMSENQMATLDRDYERRRANIEKNITDEEEKNEAIAGLDKEFEMRRKEAARAQAKRTKAVGIMEAVIHTAAAVVEALPNIPLAIAVGIMGAIQTALIAAQPLPALQKGGRIGEAGIVGEAGPELFFPGTPGTIVPLRTEATALPTQPNITIKILGSLISTTGVARADLQKAGSTLFDIIELEARRRGYTINGT